MSWDLFIEPILIGVLILTAFSVVSLSLFFKNMEEIIPIKFRKKLNDLRPARNFFLIFTMVGAVGTFLFIKQYMWIMFDGVSQYHEFYVESFDYKKHTMKVITMDNHVISLKVSEEYPCLGLSFIKRVVKEFPHEYLVGLGKKSDLEDNEICVYDFKFLEKEKERE